MLRGGATGRFAGHAFSIHECGTPMCPGPRLRVRFVYGSVPSFMLGDESGYAVCIAGCDSTVNSAVGFRRSGTGVASQGQGQGGRVRGDDP